MFCRRYNSETQTALFGAIIGMNSPDSNSADTPCLECPVCNQGSIDDAREIESIRCNVREFEHECFTVWRCPRCRSLHCREPIDFQRYYANYPLDNQSLKYLTRVAYRNRLRILQRAGLQRCHRVLDYGCGEGLFLNFLKARRFPDIHGYDPWSSGFARAPRDIPFDLVYSFGVIEHVSCPRSFLKEQRRLAGRDGKVLIATPEAAGLNLQQPDSLLMHQPYHRHILSREGIRSLALSEGLTLVRSEHRNWMDTKHPGMNSRFVTDYVDACGGTIDVLFEKRKVGLFLGSPRLWRSFWLGYYFPPTGYMVCQFQST